MTTVTAPVEHPNIVKLFDANDQKAVRNLENLLDCYRLLINEKKPLESATKYCAPNYIQHNPLLGDGPEGLAEFFAGLEAAHPKARVVIHKVAAIGNYLFAHGVFYNFLNEEDDDTGIAVVDMWRVGDDGILLEHWDVLQVVGDPRDNSAPWYGPGIPAKNPNGVVI